jgi:FMN phosphatase YigB (HAD superfamily)
MKLFLFFLVTSSLLLGEIVPITNLQPLEEKLHEIDQDTWVVFDVDLTLISPKDPILLGVWEPTFMRIAEQVNPDFKNRDRQLDWSLILLDMEWETVSPKGPALIKAIQEKGAHVVALTAMPHGRLGVCPSLSDWRIKQLNDLGFDFSLNAPDADLPNYKGGILFSDKTPKGEVFMSLIHQLGVAPKKVIFVDDHIKYIQSMEASLNEASIPLISYHYQEIEHRPVTFITADIRRKLTYFFAHNRWPKD